MMPELELPDNLPACQALIVAQQQLIEEKQRQVKLLEARLKRVRRKRKRRAQELYRSHCKALHTNARKHGDGAKTVSGA